VAPRSAPVEATGRTFTLTLAPQSVTAMSMRIA